MIIQKKWIVGTSVFLILLAGLFFFQQDDHKAEVVITESEELDEPKEEPEEVEETVTDEYIWVDVKGHVSAPGVYQIEAGSRVKDVIELAGGFLDEANELAVNMAAILQDEMVVYVAKEGEEVEETIVQETEKSGEGKVNINSASLEEMMTLPGIGEQKAKRIIDYREANGKFQTAEDLLGVSGIGEKTLEQFEEMIIVP